MLSSVWHARKAPQIRYTTCQQQRLVKYKYRSSTLHLAPHFHFLKKKVCSLCFVIIPLSTQLPHNGGQRYRYLSEKPRFQVKISDVTVIATEKSSSKKCPSYTIIDVHHLRAQEEPCSLIGPKGGRVMLWTELLSK